tara:strand:- start:8107 stop:8397 length:291 start_codon:yes stop_codon:yes gene_type:complete
MPTTKDVERLPSGRLKYSGETFAGYNKPKRTPDAAKAKAVLAKDGDQVKLVRFGDPDMKNRPNNKDARKSFRARHGCDTAAAKNKLTAKYWSCKDW